MGLSILATPKLRLHALAGISVGQFSTVDLGITGGRACANDNVARCDEVAPADREWHVFRSFNLAGSFDL